MSPVVKMAASGDPAALATEQLLRCSQVSCCARPPDGSGKPPKPVPGLTFDPASGSPNPSPTSSGIGSVVTWTESSVSTVVGVVLLPLFSVLDGCLPRFRLRWPAAMDRCNNDINNNISTTDQNRDILTWRCYLTQPQQNDAPVSEIQHTMNPTKIERWLCKVDPTDQILGDRQQPRTEFLAFIRTRSLSKIYFIHTTCTIAPVCMSSTLIRLLKHQLDSII